MILKIDYNRYNPQLIKPRKGVYLEVLGQMLKETNELPCELLLVAEESQHFQTANSSIVLKYNLVLTEKQQQSGWFDLFHQKISRLFNPVIEEV